MDVERPRRSGSRGFSLVEVLVTVIVLAIGVLGLAGLQIAGMRSNYSAYLRTQATLGAADLIDQMRVAPAEFAGRHLRTAAVGDASGSSHPILASWSEDLRSVLPRPADGTAQGEIDCAETDDHRCQTGNCEIIVRWNDSRAESAPAAGDQGSGSGATGGDDSGDEEGVTHQTLRVCTLLADERGS